MVSLLADTHSTQTPHSSPLDNPAGKKRREWSKLQNKLAQMGLQSEIDDPNVSFLKSGRVGLRLSVDWYLILGRRLHAFWPTRFHAAVSLEPAGESC